MKTVFLVEHLHILPDGEEDIKIIGIYSTREKAEAAVEKIGRQPGFSKIPKLVDFDKSKDPEGFYIDEYEIDVDSWETGYFTE